MIRIIILITEAYLKNVLDDERTTWIARIDSSALKSSFAKEEKLALNVRLHFPHANKIDDDRKILLQPSLTSSPLQ